MSVDDRMASQKLLFPTFPESLPSLGQDLASASCSITACKAILQNISFVSLHFQRKDSKNDRGNTRKLCGKAKEVIGENEVSVGWRLKSEKNTWNLCTLIWTWICLLDSFLPSVTKETWYDLCLESHWRIWGLALCREGFISGSLLQASANRNSPWIRAPYHWYSVSDQYGHGKSIPFSRNTKLPKPEDLLTDFE